MLTNNDIQKIGKLVLDSEERIKKDLLSEMGQSENRIKQDLLGEMAKMEKRIIQETGEFVADHLAPQFDEKADLKQVENHEKRISKLEEKMLTSSIV